MWDKVVSSWLWVKVIHKVVQLHLMVITDHKIQKIILPRIYHTVREVWPLAPTDNLKRKAIFFLTNLWAVCQIQYSRFNIFCYFLPIQTQIAGLPWSIYQFGILQHGCFTVLGNNQHAVITCLWVSYKVHHAWIEVPKYPDTGRVSHLMQEMMP